MNSTQNYYKIGLFVVIAIAILVVILIALGSSRLFESQKTIETFFNESVQGLQEGSTVKYLGIDIGHVKEIGLLRQIYPSLKGSLNGSRFIYVKITINNSNFASSTFINSLPKQIKKGLRAQLQPQGLTGASYLSLTFLPPSQNPPIQLPKQLKHVYAYVPSATSTITRFTDAINNIFSTLKQNDIPSLLKNVNRLSMTANKAIKDAQIPGVSRDTRRMLLSIASTANRYKTVANQLITVLRKKQVNESIDNIADITHSLKSTTVLVNQTLKSLSETIAHSNDILAQFKANEQALISNAKATSEHLSTLSKNATEFPSQLIFSKPPPHLNPKEL